MAKIIKIVNCDSCPYGPHQAGLCKEVVPFQEGIPEKCPLEDAPSEFCNCNSSRISVSNAEICGNCGKLVAEDEGCTCADHQGGPCAFCMEAKYNL